MKAFVLLSLFLSTMTVIEAQPMARGFDVSEETASMLRRVLKKRQAEFEIIPTDEVDEAERNEGAEEEE